MTLLTSEVLITEAYFIFEHPSYGVASMVFNQASRRPNLLYYEKRLTNA